MEYLLSPEEIEGKSVGELNDILKEKFSFDNFRWQQENHIRIAESFRADCLNRVLYKCPRCLAEGKMLGKDTRLTCGVCGAAYELTEYGYLQEVCGGSECSHGPGATSEPKTSSGSECSPEGTFSPGMTFSHGTPFSYGMTFSPGMTFSYGMTFSHIPDWYRWERECVRRELEEGSYRLDVEVDICMMVNTKSIYRVGSGRLQHSPEGFQLTGCGGKLDYFQKPSASYSLYSDYYWYEIGDMICIGNTDALYYCFPKSGGDVVAKTRLAAEELYRMGRQGKR